MMWILIHDGRVVASGSYESVIDTAEEWEVLARDRHLDGTWTWTRIMPGYRIMPEAMAPRIRRRAAA